jgi:hypothetical protein
MIPAGAMQLLMQLEHTMRWRIMAAEQSGGVVFMPLHSGKKHEILQNRYTILTVLCYLTVKITITNIIIFSQLQLKALHCFTAFIAFIGVSLAQQVAKGHITWLIWLRNESTLS